MLLSLFGDRKEPSPPKKPKCKFARKTVNGSTYTITVEEEDKSGAKYCTQSTIIGRLVYYRRYFYCTRCTTSFSAQTMKNTRDGWIRQPAHERTTTRCLRLREQRNATTGIAPGTHCRRLSFLTAGCMIYSTGNRCLFSVGCGAASYPYQSSGGRVFRNPDPNSYATPLTKPKP